MRNDFSENQTQKTRPFKLPSSIQVHFGHSSKGSLNQQAADCEKAKTVKYTKKTMLLLRGPGKSSCTREHDSSGVYRPVNVPRGLILSMVCGQTVLQHLSQFHFLHGSEVTLPTQGVVCPVDCSRLVTYATRSTGETDCCQNWLLSSS